MNVGTELEISMGHRLLDYKGLCAHPHGHNYRVIVSLPMLVPDPGSKEEKYGLFIDFKDLKRILMDILEPLDHAMVLREDDPLVPILSELGSRLVVWTVNPTAENFALFIQRQLMATGIAANVRVYETSKSYAEV